MTIQDVEKRVRSLETTRAVVVTVCIIFGVSGAWGYRTLEAAKKRLDAFDKPTTVFNEAKDKALQEFNQTAAEEKDRQVAAFKQESHNFTIEWEPTVDTGMIDYNHPDWTNRSLGKHDICIIVATDFHILANGDSSCSLALDDGGWKLSTAHMPQKDNAGSATGCKVMCGKIK